MSRSGATRMLRLCGADPQFWIAGAMVAFFLLIAVWPSSIAGLFGHGDPRACDLVNSRGAPDPTAGHPFSFSIQGCDLFASVVYGAANSVTVGLVVTIGTSIVAIVLGILSGYFGGWVDTLLSRIFGDLRLGSSASRRSARTQLGRESQCIVALSAVLIVFAWPTAMRVMRTSTISVRARSYVTADPSARLPNWRILLSHIAPNTVGTVIVLGTHADRRRHLERGGADLSRYRATGALRLSSGHSRSRRLSRYFASSPHLLYFPAIALTLAVTGFVLFGEAVRRAGDSRR